MKYQFIWSFTDFWLYPKYYRHQPTLFYHWRLTSLCFSILSYPHLVMFHFCVALSWGLIFQFCVELLSSVICRKPVWAPLHVPVYICHSGDLASFPGSPLCEEGVLGMRLVMTNSYQSTALSEMFLLICRLMMVYCWYATVWNHQYFNWILIIGVGLEMRYCTSTPLNKVALPRLSNNNLKWALYFIWGVN